MLVKQSGRRCLSCGAPNTFVVLPYRILRHVVCCSKFEVEKTQNRSIEMENCSFFLGTSSSLLLPSLTSVHYEKVGYWQKKKSRFFQKSILNSKTAKKCNKMKLLPNPILHCTVGRLLKKKCIDFILIKWSIFNFVYRKTFCGFYQKDFPLRSCIFHPCSVEILTWKQNSGRNKHLNKD